MTIEQTRARVIAGVWQAIAQSGVDLSTVPQDQQERLVGRIADGMLMTLNSLLDEDTETVPSPPAVDEFNEQILWRGRPFLSLVETYILTSERLKIVKGLIARDIENFELIRIQDIDFTQGVGERMFGLGDITIRGQDTSNAAIVLRNVENPDQVYEILRRAWLEARKRHGLQFREYM